MPTDDKPITSKELDAASLPRARPVKLKGMVRARLSPQMASVLELMAYEGVDIRTAAQRVDMHIVSARQAFARPAVKASFAQLVKEIRDNAAQSAYLRINHISQNATSEAVKLDANKWVAGVDGLSPIKRIEGRHSHTHAFAGFEYVKPGGIARDITPEPDSLSGGDDD